MTPSYNNMFLLLQHRQVLLEIFSKNYRVRRNMIQSRLTQECGEDLSKQEVDKVLKVHLSLVIIHRVFCASALTELKNEGAHLRWRPTVCGKGSSLVPFLLLCL